MEMRLYLGALIVPCPQSVFDAFIQAYPRVNPEGHQKMIEKKATGVQDAWSSSVRGLINDQFQHTMLVQCNCCFSTILWQGKLRSVVL